MIIRWSRLVPRLLLIIAILAALWWVQDQLIGYIAKVRIENQTGAAAEIGQVRTDWANGRVQFEGVRLVDPKRADRELLYVDKLTGKAELRDLMFKYFHFPEIDIEGIRVTLDSGDGENWVPDKYWDDFKKRIPDIAADGNDLSSLLVAAPEEAVKKLVAQSETSKMVDELAKSWPNKLAEFSTQSNSIQTRFQRIKQLWEIPPEQASRVAVFAEILKECEQIELELKTVLVEVDQLKGDAKSDYQSLRTVLSRDQESLKNLSAPEAEFVELAQMLIGPEIKDQWDRILAWTDWVQTLLVSEETPEGPAPIYERLGLNPPKQFKGETFHFAALDARPELLVQRINMTGQVIFGTMPLFFNGTIDHLAHNMDLGPQPLSADFCFSGSGIPVSAVSSNETDTANNPLASAVNSDLVPEVYVKLQIDRLGGRSADQIEVRCPYYRLPERLLGNPAKFAVALSPGVSRFHGVIHLNESALSGQVRVEQAGIRMTAQLPGENAALQGLIQPVLDSLDQFSADIYVTGTRDAPMYSFKSNITDQLQPRLKAVFREQWDSIRTQANSELTGRVNQAITMLNSVVQDQIDSTVGQLNAQQSAWQKQMSAESAVLDQLIRTQTQNLSPADQERLNQFMNNPLVQSTLGASGVAPDQPLEQTIQQGLNKVQDKLPGLLDRLRKKD